MLPEQLKQRKINKLLDEYGTTLEAIAEEAICGDSAGVPAICMNVNCNATYEYEPDQDRGYCEECKTNSVKSILILAGMI